MAEIKGKTPHKALMSILKEFKLVYLLPPLPPQVEREELKGELRELLKMIENSEKALEAPKDPETPNSYERSINNLLNTIPNFAPKP